MILNLSDKANRFGITPDPFNLFQHLLELTVDTFFTGAANRTSKFVSTPLVVGLRPTPIRGAGTRTAVRAASTGNGYHKRRE